MQATKLPRPRRPPHRIFWSPSEIDACHAAPMTGRPSGPLRNGRSSRCGTDGSNPSPCCGESRANVAAFFYGSVVQFTRPTGPACTRDRWFESAFLQQGVCLCTEPQRRRRRVPRFCGGQLVHRDERRDGLAANSSLFAFFLWRALAQSHPEGHSRSNALADRDDAAYW